MTKRTFFYRLFILAFIVLVGYCLARSIHNQNVLGIVLALVSLGATTYFIYLLAKAREEMERERSV